MTKVLRIAAVMVSIAAAIPSGGTSLLGAGLMSAGVAATATAATAIAGAISLATSFAAQLTAKKPSINGSQTEWTSDPNAPIPIIFGDTLVAGITIYRKTSGKKGKYQYLGAVLSGCGPVDAITASYFDDTATTFSGNNAVGSLHGRVYQATQLGASPEASALSPSGPWGTLPEWTAAHKLSGFAAVMNAFVFDGKGDETFTQLPTAQWRLRGVKCYDPRQDSTYPGGSGSQRWNDESTWAWSANPYVQTITFAIGWHQGASKTRVGGVGMPLNSLDLPALVEAANIADFNNWQSHGRVLSTDPKWDVLKALCQAGGGEPMRLGATLSCIINTPRVPIGTITSADLIGSASVTTTQTRRNRVNGIIAKYRSEAHKFEQVPAGVVRSAEYLAQDGAMRTKEQTYAMVQCFGEDPPTQAAQLAAYDIANAREAGPAVLPLKLKFLGYRAGDCLSIANEPEFGYLANKHVIVIRRQFDPEGMGVVLTVREETPAKHTWALSQTGEASPTTSPNLPNEPEAPEVGEWNVSPRIDYVESLPTGTIVLTGAVDDESATQVVVEYRQASSPNWIQSTVLPVSATRHEINGLDTTKAWEVAVSYFAGHRFVFSNISFSTATVDSEVVLADSSYFKVDRE